MGLLVITIVFLAFYGVLILYYYSSWKKLENQTINSFSKKTFISVIVPARNEEKDIGALLTSLQNQDYDKNFFEIIVVDDFSTDRTIEVVNQFKLSNLLVIQPNTDSRHSSKKKAIETAVAKAKGELIVTTDADCVAGESWLQVINGSYLQANANFIAAPVKYFHDNSLLQIFQSLDFLTLQGITAASVASGFHTMCNGANLAYKKKSFVDVNGFEGIDKVATGDDMLLMYKIWKKDRSKVHYLKNREAIVCTQPMLSWKDFLNQRRRWASKTLVYDDYKIIAVLGFIYLFNCLFFVLLTAAFINSDYWILVIGFLIFKTLIEWPFVSSVAKFYNEQKLMKYFPFFQPVHIFYTVFVGLISQFGKYEWKGRRTK